MTSADEPGERRGLLPRFTLKDSDTFLLADALGLKFADPQLPETGATAEPVVDLYDDVKDLDGQTFQPPLNGRRQAINEYPHWAQAVTVESVAEHNLTSVIAKDPKAPAVKVTVRILRNGREVYRRSWLAVARMAAPRRLAAASMSSTSRSVMPYFWRISVVSCSWSRSK